MNTNKDVTIKEVAERAGVSIATVSRTLNGASYVKKDTYDAVMAAIDALGYKKRSEELQDRKRIIIVILPDLINPFYSKVVDGIQAAAAAKDFSCFLYLDSNLDRHVEGLAEKLTELSPMGIITMSPILDASTIKKLESCAPVVQCTEFNEQSSTSFVSIDDYASSKSIVEYIISRGRSRIVIMNGPKKFKYSRERYRGYKDALTETGLEVIPQFVANISDVNFSSALSIATQLLSLPNRPDAFFCVSDVYAAAVVKAAASLNIRIPEELGVVGFDNTYITMLSHPSISSVNQPRYEIGFTACEVLIEKINNPSSDHQHIYMQTEFVIRDSM